MSNTPENTDSDAVAGSSQGHLDDWNFYSDTSQNVIETTEDKLRLCLMKYSKAVTTRKSWAAPATLLATLVIALVTTNFKEEAFSIAGSTWQALFLFSVAATVLWLIQSLCSIYKQRKKSTIDFVISTFKSGSED